ncbi:MAG: DUF3305 domain-containing protein [Hyphomicrobiales bacterium]|nr:DUF3305 domain-containing protein [Hyphomicrobiales bacterium]MCP5371817.1 DUF3305 domain-containing protein [Hyphomicrobiales bacterium]
MAADQSMPMGVVIERRRIDNPWQDHAWMPVAVIPGAGPVADWVALAEGADWVHFHAATLDLELFRGETEGYRYNLSQPRPTVFVVLRRGEEADEPDVVPFLVTACPYEAEGYLESGDEIVEGVTMPDQVVAWVQDFVDRHHVDVPFKKRKNRRLDPRSDGRGRR